MRSENQRAPVNRSPNRFLPKTGSSQIAMPPFRDLPIRRKLTFFIMLVSCLALVMSILAVLAYELFTFRARSVSDVVALADMIKASTQSALDFNDRKLAQEILNVLRSERE